MVIQPGSVSITLRNVGPENISPRSYYVEYTKCADDDPDMCCKGAFDFVSLKGGISEDDLMKAISQAILDREVALSDARTEAKKAEDAGVAVDVAMAAEPIVR